MVSEGSQWAALADLPGVEVLGYGINRPGRVDPDGVPMLRAGDIADGRIQCSEVFRVERKVADAHPKTRLRSDDLLIVLVGRIGEAVVTRPEHEEWAVARSVALVRCADPGIAQWLRVWFTMPAIRAWCEAQSAGTAQRTLGLRALRKLPVGMPPLEERDRALRIVRAIEERIQVDERIAHTAVALADAHFGALAVNEKTWSERTFKDVVRTARTGKTARPSPVPQGEEWVVPGDVLRSPLPYIDTMEVSDLSHALGPVLVVPSDGRVSVALGRVSAEVSRGVLAVSAERERDMWWLLHSIRSRSTELARLAQGAAGRELSARAFEQATVAWPPQDVLAHFGRSTSALHRRALAAQSESRTLRVLLTDFLRTLEPVEVPLSS
ncbi:hypothetical protein ACH4E8_22815 [Streptomyces sp. NPDC017979]|uniref:hypothetical protein n=1 Tax=Streptomyces sp. NPDC017979 TaxID=3365024 RepID=UPI0037A1B013